MGHLSNLTLICEDLSNITIKTDSQAAIDLIAAVMNTKCTDRKILKLSYHVLLTEIRIEIQRIQSFQISWVKGHSGIKENELVDIEANRARQMEGTTLNVAHFLNLTKYRLPLSTQTDMPWLCIAGTLEQQYPASYIKKFQNTITNKQFLQIIKTSPLKNLHQEENPSNNRKRAKTEEPYNRLTKNQRVNL